MLTTDELLRLNDPTDGLINIPAVCDSCTTVSRNAIRACLGITFQDGVCGPNTCASNPNDQTCFTLPGSIPVRLPDIDDGGELKNGNEQISKSFAISRPRRCSRHAFERSASKTEILLLPPQLKICP